MWKFFILIHLFAVTLQAGTILDNVDDQKYIEYGKNIDCVVQMIGTIDNTLKSQFSGVIIHPNWIITSAHTLDNEEKFYFIDKQGQRIEVVEYYLHPKFNKNSFGSIDVALCYVKEKIQISFIPELYESNDEVGKIVCISGFGMTGTGLTGAKKWDNQKRAGSNFVDSIEKNMLICSMSNKYEKVTSLEFCISPGDSGGGLFIDKKLAGINSCVIHKDKILKSRYEDESGHTRISNKECLSWIKYIIYEQ